MCNIENKVDSLIKDCLKELVDAPSNSPIKFEAMHKTFPTHKRQKKFYKNVVYYSDLDENLLFIVNEGKKQVILNRVEYGKEFEMKGYELFYFDKIKKEYNAFIEKLLVKLIDTKDCEKLYEEEGLSLEETFSKSSKDYYDIIIYEFIYDNISRDNLQFFDSWITSMKKGEDTSYDDLLIHNNDFDAKMVDFFNIYDLSDEEKYDYILNNDSYILDTLHNWDINFYIEERFKKNLINKAKEELGDLSKNDKIQEYLEIAKALDKAGKTVYVNGEKIKNRLNYYRGIRVDNIKIDNIKTIEFRNKLLYQK